MNETSETQDLNQATWPKGLLYPQDSKLHGPSSVAVSNAASQVWAPALKQRWHLDQSPGMENHIQAGGALLLFLLFESLQP